MVNGSSEKLVFVDLETGGVETWRPIIQIAAIATDSGLRELESYEAKIRFDERYAAPHALNKNHYSKSRWKREAKSAAQVLDEFGQLLRRHATVDQVSSAGRVFQVAQLVAHNGAFDGGFLSAWFDRMDSFLPASPRVLCTMQRAIWLFHEDKSLTPPADYKLGSLCEYFGVSLPAEQAHDALNDVRATVALYREMTQSTAARQHQPREESRSELAVVSPA